MHIALPLPNLEPLAKVLSVPSALYTAIILPPLITMDCPQSSPTLRFANKNPSLISDIRLVSL